MNKRNFLLLPAAGLAALFGARRARAEGIYNPSVMQSASVNGASHLILKTSSGGLVDAGSVVSGLPISLVFSWGGSLVSAGSYVLPSMPYGINVTSLNFSSPAGNSMTASVFCNGLAVGNLSGIILNAPGSTVASGAGLTVAAGSSLSLVLSAVNANAIGASVQINGIRI